MIPPGTCLQDARVVAERLRVQLRDRIIPAIGSSVTASFGVAELNPADATAENLLHRADQAMYQAKALGRDQVADSPTEPSGRTASHLLNEPFRMFDRQRATHPFDPAFRSTQADIHT